jgi:hypothetical protein
MGADGRRIAAFSMREGNFVGSRVTSNIGGRNVFLSLSFCRKTRWNRLWLELGRTLSEADAARPNNFRSFVLPSGNCFE